jgi:phosphoribosylaminoimidazolecarboxamide formyltransferase/IMP cyclohydrolase
MTARRWALISVSDKQGLDQLARGLVRHGFGILSTGGSAASLRQAGIEVVDVSAHTGQVEMMDGRVKTLHPRIHGGILARPGVDDAALTAHGIDNIDFVVVNLYPFRETIAKPDCTLPEAIENIDIGGPSLLRAAAKNHVRVCVVCDPADYAGLLDELERDGRIGDASRYRLAAKAFAHTASYDSAIAAYLGAREAPTFPADLHIHGRLSQTLRYGENPHQQAAFYRDLYPAPGSLATFAQLQGKELSYNNIADADAALGVRAPVRCTGLRHRQARQSLRRGRRQSAGRPPTSGLRHRPDQCLRRHHRVQYARWTRDCEGSSSTASSSRC